MRDPRVRRHVAIDASKVVGKPTRMERPRHANARVQEDDCDVNVARYRLNVGHVLSVVARQVTTIKRKSTLG